MYMVYIEDVPVYKGIMGHTMIYAQQHHLVVCTDNRPSDGLFGGVHLRWSVYASTGGTMDMYHIYGISHIYTYMVYIEGISCI